LAIFRSCDLKQSEVAPEPLFSFFEPSRDGPKPLIAEIWHLLPESFIIKPCTMSLDQILKELPNLTPEERREIFEQLAELETKDTYTPTPPESAAIDEAIRSLEAGKGIPAAEIRQRFAAKWSR
jgi:hypothetical protein